MYLVHLPLVVAAQAIVHDWDFFAGVKFLLICAVVTAVSLLSYQAFVRYTPIGTMLNGKKTRPSRSVASA